MFRVIDKYDKGTVVQIATVFVPVYHVICGIHSAGRFFRHFSNHLFRRRQFRKYIGYEGHLIFENAQNLM